MSTLVPLRGVPAGFPPVGVFGVGGTLLRVGASTFCGNEGMARLRGLASITGAGFVLAIFYLVSEFDVRFDSHLILRGVSLGHPFQNFG